MKSDHHRSLGPTTTTTNLRCCTCFSTPTWGGSRCPARAWAPITPDRMLALGQARLSTGPGSPRPISAASESELRSQSLSCWLGWATGGPPTRTARESPMTAPSYPYSFGPTGVGDRWYWPTRAANDLTSRSPAAPATDAAHEPAHTSDVVANDSTTIRVIRRRSSC